MLPRATIWRISAVSLIAFEKKYKPGWLIEFQRPWPA
jgi:hypothetical protein